VDLTVHGGPQFGVQPVMDDVIINAVPEPSGWISVVVAFVSCGCFIQWKRKTDSLSSRLATKWL
jgi:hypothetical protein